MPYLSYATILLDYSHLFDIALKTTFSVFTLSSLLQEVAFAEPIYEGSSPQQLNPLLRNLDRC